ncbi:MAG TPA: hypothetical protein VL284_17600 [Thermoanaerobaculia bacterium]|nr:hypothetical protein [Thermoanaerobaculia bacterium]
MANELWNTLLRFHSDVLLPDVERTGGQRVDARVGGLSDEMPASFDGVYKRFDRLDDEFQSVRAAMRPH